MVSDNFWRTRLGGDRNAVGQALHLDGESSIVVGVLRPGFSFDYPTLGSPEPADIYVPDVGRICIRIGSERQSRPRANSRNPHEYVHRVNQFILAGGR